MSKVTVEASDLLAVLRWATALSRGGPGHQRDPWVPMRLHPAWERLRKVLEEVDE